MEGHTVSSSVNREKRKILLKIFLYFPQFILDLGVYAYIFNPISGLLFILK